VGDLADEGVQITCKGHPAGPGASDGEIFQEGEEFKSMSAVGLDAVPVGSFWRVQLPLASPLIFAGLRTSLVLIIGTATLGNFIGGGGLGDVIASGINISNRIIFVGAVMVATLALLADWALSLVGRMTVPRQISV